MKRTTRKERMGWDGCTIDFTIRRTGSVRRYSYRGEALTFDVVTDVYPNIEVRRDEFGGYICQYRVAPGSAIRLGAGSSMQDAVSYGLGKCCKAGYTAERLQSDCLKVSQDFERVSA